MAHRLLILFSIMLMSGVHGQPQLAILRGQKVVATVRPGSELSVKRHSMPGVFGGFLVQADEFSIITSRDTIQIRDIRSISSGRRETFVSRAGKALMIGGLGYFAADQVNNLFIPDRPNFDRQVSITAAALVLSGIPLSLIRKKWDRPGRGNTKILTVGHRSRFYRE